MALINFSQCEVYIFCGLLTPLWEQINAYSFIYVAAALVCDVIIIFACICYSVCCDICLLPLQQYRKTISAVVMKLTG